MVPMTRPKKSDTHKKEARMEKAVHAVQEQGVKIRKAARDFDVWRQTLKD
jgi:transposase-like protein